MRDRYGNRIRPAPAGRRAPESPRRALVLKLAFAAIAVLAAGLAVLAARVT